MAIGCESVKCLLDKIKSIKKEMSDQKKAETCVKCLLDKIKSIKKEMSDQKKAETCVKCLLDGPDKLTCDKCRKKYHRSCIPKSYDFVGSDDEDFMCPKCKKQEEMVDIIEIGLEDLEVNNEVLFDEDTLIADDLPMEEKTVQLGDGNILTTVKEYVSRAVQVKVQYRSKNIQVAPEKKDISTSPIKNKGIIRLPVIHSSSESSLLSSIPTVVPPLDSSYQINTSKVRGVSQKRSWENTKAKRTKEIMAEKQARLKTGGGSYTSPSHS
ncbi:hypothetical protein M8J75_008868 [Diaphorina citri]|nr:hypothetical protein M8J75_008868 [Diaphorina citri]